MTITTTSAGTGRFAQLASAAELFDKVHIAPHLALLRLEVVSLRPAFQPGDKVKLAVPGARPKSYTPARVGEKRLEIVVELHGQGPTAFWAAQAEPGDVLWTTSALPSLQVPPGRVWLQGDATTLGLALALHEDPRYHLSGVVELRPEDVGGLAVLGLPLTAGPVGGPIEVPVHEVDCAVVAGEAGRVAEGYRALKAAGIGRICAKPYWSLLGSVHRKWVAATTGGVS